MKEAPADHSSFERGILWMLLSATSLSISFLFLKITLEYINYSFLVFLRFSIPFAVVVGIITVGGKWGEVLVKKRLWLQFARAGCVLIAQYSFAYYVIQNTLLNATVLLNASPLIIPLLEWIFMDRRPAKSTIFGALLAFLGMILILQPDSTLFTLTSAIGILAAFGQAGSQVLYGLKSRKENLLGTLFYLFSLTTLFSFLLFLFTKKEHEVLVHFKSSDWILLIYVLLMAVATLLNQYYRGLAYRCSHPSALATFLYFSVFVSALFDWLVFKNDPSILSVIGGALIILGGVLKVFLRAHILKRRKKQ